MDKKVRHMVFIKYKMSGRNIIHIQRHLNLLLQLACGTIFLEHMLDISNFAVVIVSIIFIPTVLKVIKWFPSLCPLSWGMLTFMAPSSCFRWIALFIAVPSRPCSGDEDWPGAEPSGFYGEISWPNSWIWYWTGYVNGKFTWPWRFTTFEGSVEFL